MKWGVGGTELGKRCPKRHTMPLEGHILLQALYSKPSGTGTTCSPNLQHRLQGILGACVTKLSSVLLAGMGAYEATLEHMAL